MKMPVVVSLILVAAGWMTFSSAAGAQTKQQPFPAKPGLTAQQLHGREVLVQHCSLCHLPQLPRPRDSYGPSLSGVLKDSTPADEQAIRTMILKGDAKMPGFQYALKPAEVADLIAFLKTTF